MINKGIHSFLVLSLCAFSISLSGCNYENEIKVSASIIPHAKILNEVIKPILKEKGYNLKVKTLNWSIQNDSLLHYEYDANYFQHTPFLNEYEYKDELAVAAKIHYEKLCMYASNKDENKQLDDGETIEIVNDITNIERALLLLQDNKILTINDSVYVDGKFKNFNIINPNKSVTFSEQYKHCTLTCIAESNLCLSLDDYNFGIIPGNTALLGLKDASSSIVLSEKADAQVVSNLSNIIAVRKDNIHSDKIKALIDAFKDARVEKYIEETFGDAVIYTFESFID